MKVRLTLAILSVLVLFCFPAFSQRDTLSLPTIITKMNQLVETRPIEKVYLHFDKPYYAVGDTIWFKAYLTHGIHQPSELSKIVYVDVISSRDSLVQTFMLPVKDGIATGSVFLTQPLYKQDNYHFKAYTKWMANFDQAYFFNKTISIGSVTNPVTTSIAFKRSVNNNVSQVDAAIYFKDPEGKPFADKKVGWSIAVKYEEVAKGKGSTDQKGLLNISYVNSKLVNLSDAILSTSLEAENRKIYSQNFSLKPAALPADVQFFPEGGNLISGISTKVAVKAIQSNGLGIGFTAVLTDNSGNTITTFKSQHAGMGVFSIIPEAGKTYKASIDFTDGSKGTYDLPRIQSGGFTLSVNNADTSRVFVKLSADSTYLKSHLNQTYYLLGKSGQIICYAAKTNLVGPIYSAYIPSNKFPAGIVQFTLMTAMGQPISERIVFIQRRDQLGITLKSDKLSYGSRQKVKLNVVTKNNQVPAESNLSIAVIDENKIPVDENGETTILSSLLLTSDLKGYIENPNYYFKQVNEKVSSDLDLLMLTQGYRRFTYQEVLTNKLPVVTSLPEQGIELSGTLRTLDGRPFKGGTVTLQIPDKYFSTRTISDGGGKFIFQKLAFTDTAKVIVHAKTNFNAKSLMVMMDGSGYPVTGKNPNYPDERLNIDTMMAPYLANIKKMFDNSRVLKEIVLTTKAPAKSNAPSHKDYSSLAGLSSISGSIISGDRLRSCNSLITCLQTMAVGVTFQDLNFFVTRDYNAGKRIPMAIFANGMPVDMNYLNGVNSAEIESVEVFLRDELGLVNNTYQTNGVLSINMKEAPKGTRISLQELQDLLPQPNVVKLTPKGYTISKEFYSPKYVAGINSFGPDLRTTIYWNPRLYTDAAGNASVEFFSADAKGTYRAVVEGIDKDGHIGRTVYRFKVE